MLDKKHVCIVVDAFSTGRYLAPGFISAGYDCLHIQSTSDIPKPLMGSFRNDDFIDNIVYDGNLSALLDKLKNYQIKLILPGIDTGVYLSDLLNNELKLKTKNSLEFSLARRDKYLMAKEMAARSVPCAPHFKSSSLGAILEFIKGTLNFPVVLKPLKSTASDGIHYCHTEAEVEKAFSNIKTSKDYWGNSNDEVLVQAYLDGDEYVVNSVSCEGVHFVTDIWKMHRLVKEPASHSFVYDHAELINFSSEEFKSLESYVHKVLNSLEIKFGPAHSEIMLSKIHGPRLIETSARMEGSMDPSAVIESLGYSQVSKVIQAYLDPNAFLIFAKSARLPKLKDAICVYLISPDEGYINHNAEGKLFTTLNTYHSGAVFLRPGDFLGKTALKKTGPTKNPGYVYLVGNFDEVKADYIKIRDLEKTFYKNLVSNSSLAQGLGQAGSFRTVVAAPVQSNAVILGNKGGV